MSFVAFTLVIILKIYEVSSSPSYPVGDIRNCPTEQIVNPGSPLLRMNALPGLGFDNLRSIELGQVYYRNYTSCQVSNDGHYLLPDNIYLIPVLKSEVDFFAEAFDHYDDWSSSTSASIDIEAKLSFILGQISGKFSAEYQHAKNLMVNSNSRSVRMGLRHHLYSVHVNPDGQLHPSFKSRLMDLAAHIQNNNTEMAHYLSDLIVRDYGTHVVTSVEAGGALYQSTFISQETEQHNTNGQIYADIDLAASARILFFITFSFNVDLNFHYDSSNVDEISSKTQHVLTTTHGGPPFRLGNFSYIDWQNELPDNLVAIDRRGEPLSFVITTTNLPELPDVLLMKTADFVYQAIARYYKINTIMGCTDIGSPNFNFHANLGDNSCRNDRQNFTFGGIYQTCYDYFSNRICKDYQQINPLTGDYSCPDGYDSVLLHTGTVKELVFFTRNWPQCLFCREMNYQTMAVLHGRYKAYWCYARPGSEVPADSGYMFGGAYTSKSPNPVTRTSSCPPFYDTLHFAEDIKVCVSNDEEGKDNALHFGGFHSCSSGNPLSITKSKYSKLSSSTTQEQLQDGSFFPPQCPQHYNQFLLTVDQGCIVNYCSIMRDINKFSPMPPILPPYKNKPPITVNESESLVIVGPYGKVWAKGDDGTWSEYEADSKTGYDYIQSLMIDEHTPQPPTKPSSNATNNSTVAVNDDTIYVSHYSDSEIVGIVLGSVFATALCIGFIVALGVGIKKYQKKRKARKESLLYLDKSVPEQHEETEAIKLVN